MYTQLYLKQTTNKDLLYSTGRASLVAQSSRIYLQCRSLRRHGFNPCIRKIPWRRAWQPTLVFLPENPMDKGAWPGYSPQRHKELDTNKVTQHALIQHWEFSSVLCEIVDGREFGLEGMHVCKWLISFAIHLKLPQHCQSALHAHVSHLVVSTSL